MSTTVSHQVPAAQQQAISDLTGYEDAAMLRWQQACVQAANTLTALPNGRYVNVRMERMRQGLELAQRGAVTLPEEGEDLSAVVRSGNNIYQVDTRLLTCTCADYQKHLQACKHVLATEIHTGALGLAGRAEELLTSPATEPAITTSLPPAAPTTASWPISEAPASLNIKLKVGNMEFMLTMQDVGEPGQAQGGPPLQLQVVDDAHGQHELHVADLELDVERRRRFADRPACRGGCGGWQAGGDGWLRR